MKTKYKHYAFITASALGLTGLSFASDYADEKYVYDASGNILEKRIGDQVTRYDYKGNQLIGSDGDSAKIQYQYDTSGRLITEKGEGTFTRKMEHQYQDKVTKVENVDKTTVFFYNAEGQLVATSSSGTYEAYAWDGLAMVNRGERLYVNEAHAVGGVPAIVGDEVAVSDMIGTSLSTGNKLFKSTAYGEGLQDGLFTGKPFVVEFDSFLFKYRNYSPASARWKSPDPSGFPDGINSVLYVNNDPLTYYDPNGLEAFVQDFAFVTVTSRPNNNNEDELTPSLSRLVGTLVYSRYNEIKDELGVCGYSTEPEGDAVSFEFLPPSVIYNDIPARHNKQEGGVDWSRYEAPIKGYAVAYISDDQGAPVQGTSVNLDGINSDFYTRWIQEN